MATQSEKPLFVQQLEAYDALIPLKPEGWGEIRKKDKLSGLIEESKLAEILDHITQRDDLEKMIAGCGRCSRISSLRRTTLRRLGCRRQRR